MVYTDFGMMGSGMMGSGMMGFGGGSILVTALFVGLVLLVWLAVFKLWKDLFGTRHR